MRAVRRADDIVGGRPGPGVPRGGLAMRARSYHNAMLTVIAVLLAVLVVGRFDSGGWGGVTLAQGAAQPRASAEPEESGAAARISAAEQRKTMIAQLREISSRLDRIEAVLRAGLDVRVKEMPPTKDKP